MHVLDPIDRMTKQEKQFFLPYLPNKQISKATSSINTNTNPNALSKGDLKPKQSVSAASTSEQQGHHP